jgi:phenylpropionate dioxygenase-like ring-hydroxylating dioxygenase large terminal subunit
MNAPIPTLDAWPEQSIRGHSISGSRYTTREFMEREWDGMWTRVWLLLGRAAELPEPGDWQMEPVGREEILMVRQQDDSIKAFYNVCQHRGNPLVDESKGSNPRRFVCRYHSWAFLPDGALQFAPDKEDFPQGNPCGKLGEHGPRLRTLERLSWPYLGRVAGTRSRHLAEDHG